MAITTAVQRGGFVYVYGEKGAVLCTIPSGSQSGDGLKGFTSSTVSVRRGSFIYVYSERGSIIQTVPA